MYQAAVARRAARIAPPIGIWGRIAAVLRLLLVLGKARVVGLVTFTAVVPAVVAAGGHPAPAVILIVLTVGVLAGGGAGAINHVLDRDLDRRMQRTAQRPLATGQARVGVVASLAATALAAGLLVAWQASPGMAVHTFVAAATYVLVYTRLLKRHTPQSIVIGGWTGAAAVLAGWEAGGQALSLTALALAAVVFLWTPAHFWSLAIARVDDYRRAGVPALPVVLGLSASLQAIVASAALTGAAATLPLIEGRLGLWYALGLVAATTLFGVPLWRLCRRPDPALAWQAYKASGLSLLLLFLGALVDSLARPV